MRNIVFLLILFCMDFGLTQAQEITFTRPEKLSSKIEAYDLIGRTSSGIILFKWGQHLQEAQCFDPVSMKSKWNKEVKLLGKDIDVIEAINLGNEIILIYSARQNGENILYGQRFNASMKPVGTMAILDKTKRKFGGRGFEYEVRYNEDKSVFAVLKKAVSVFNYDQIDMFILDRSLTQLFTKSIDLDEDEWYKETMISLEGDVFLVTGFIKRSVFSNIPQFEKLVVSEIRSGEGERKVEIGENEFLVNDIELGIDRVGDDLIIAGFYSKTQVKFVNGYFYLNVDLAEMKVNNKVFSKFPVDLIKKYPRKNLFGGSDLNSKNVGSFDYVSIRDLIVRSDGGALIMGEYFYQSEQNNMSRTMNPSVIGTRQQAMTTFHYEEVFVLSINPDGTYDWGEVLRKNQFSEDDNAYYSSFAVHNGSDKMHVIFNEDIKFSTNVTSYILKADGGVDIRGLLNTSSYNVLLAPRYAKQLSRKEILIPGYNQRMEFLLAKVNY